MPRVPHDGEPTVPDDPAAVAVFDFDGTLTRRDTAVAWLTALAGRWQVLLALAAASLGTLAGWWRRRPAAERRTGFKQALYDRLVAGRTVAEAEAAADAIRPHLAWHEAMVERLASHRARGHRIVIASGSARLAVARLAAERCPPDVLIATELEVGPDGRLTGRLAGPNCVREAKARQVAAWLADAGPVRQTYGYGNRPHDLAMLALVDHPTVV